MRTINSDTIAAVATPPGGAIGLLRLSGPEALSITSALFHPARQATILAQAEPNTLHYGRLKTMDGEDIDDVMVGIYRAPHSYTGEDCVEIGCHGSAYIMQQALHALIEAGARQAAPGEYTQRAYLNGKMDLSQAEAVADLIASGNRAAHKLALSQLKGHFSSELSVLRQQLLRMTSLIELELDFSDHEELEFADRSELMELACTIEKHISALSRSFETGNAIKKGVPVAIVGKTNVGKSTLLNQLLHEDKAIVSDIDGTTRDVIEDCVEIHGITFRFIDTAGIRNTQDKIERIGIERTYQKLSEATIVLWVIDSRPTEEEVENMLAHTTDQKIIIVHNKIDILSSAGTATEAARILLENRNASAWSTSESVGQDSLSDTLLLPALSARFPQSLISAKLGYGIHELEELIYTTADIPEIDENSVMVTNARHYEALSRAKAGICRVISGIDMSLSGDLLAEDLRTCLEELSEITGGAITSVEVLGNIFQNFCIGK